MINHYQALKKIRSEIKEKLIFDHDKELEKLITQVKTLKSIMSNMKSQTPSENTRSRKTKIEDAMSSDNNKFSQGMKKILLRRIIN
jgi:hypothetical protein